MVSARDPYVVTGLFGLLLYFIGVAIFTVAVLIGDPAAIVFMLFFLVPGLIVGVALLRWRRWGLIVAALLSLVGLIFLSADMDLFLSTPEAFFDFSSTLFGVVGLLIVFFASLVGTVQYFRRPVAAQSSGVHVAFKALAAVIAVIAVISLVLTIANIGDVSEAEAQGAVVLVAKEAEFDLKMIEATPGEPLRILLRNDDPAMHTFTIDDLDIDVKMGPWTEEIVVIESQQPRILGFICRIEGHEEDMTGAIVFE